MKFDICLMNPPYDKSLHLKFLEKAISISDNVVSVQPIRWLEETVGRFNKSSAYKKYEDSISKHISDLEVITAEEAKRIFNILLPANVGIYVCNDNGGYDYSSLGMNSIMNTVVDYIINNLCNIEENKKDGYRVRVPSIVGGGKTGGSGERPPHLTGLYLKNIVFKDGKKDGKWWYEYYMRNQYSKTSEEITTSIKFNTEKEAENFIKSFNTDFASYVENLLITDVNISNTKVLWMGNAKHPKTGKIGYKSEWTDDDFNKFFNLSKDEIQIYKDFMNSYRENRSQWFKDHNKIEK